MKSINKNVSSLSMIVFCVAFVQAQLVFAKSVSQDSIVLAPNVSVTPIVDGKGDDQCWQNVPWQSINNVWIPYGTPLVDSADFYGRYKIVWSSTTNLLYFLIEVNDDVLVDGFQYGQTADVYNFDIAEVFIDEDTSGGLHIFDATGNNIAQFGSNAENAFTYHIYADFPAIDQITTGHYVYDLDGTDWSHVINRNYASHLQDFALRKTSNTTAAWEFSLKVYNDTYEDDNSNKENARVQLAAGKVMGLSVAYCDNDGANENPKVRDNMFGSVWEPNPGNLHWQNADYFGRVKLVSDGSTGVRGENNTTESNSNIYPNPASSHSVVQLDNSYRGEISVRMFNVLGQEVFQTTTSKNDRLFKQKLLFNHLPAGPYFIRTQMGNKVAYGKLIIMESN